MAKLHHIKTEKDLLAFIATSARIGDAYLTDFNGGMRVRGPWPTFRLRSGWWYCLNYPSSYEPIAEAFFEKWAEAQ